MQSTASSSDPVNMPGSNTNPNPRFYIPTSSYASPSLPSSSSFSTSSLALHRRRSSQAFSVGSGGPSRSQSRANLTAALQAYKVPPEQSDLLEPNPGVDMASAALGGSSTGRTDSDPAFEQPSGAVLYQTHSQPNLPNAAHPTTRDETHYQTNPQTPPSAASAYAQAYSRLHTDPESQGPASSSSLALNPYLQPDAYPDFDRSTRSNSGLHSALDLAIRPGPRPGLGDPSRMTHGQDVAGAVPPELMDALVEIHRVLYRGNEDKVLKRHNGEWEGEVKEVKRVVERWFEGDCVYDHPLVRVPSRPSLLTHFVLLHLLSDVSIPALTPAHLVSRARGLASSLRKRLLAGVQADGDVEAGDVAISGKGKGKERLVDLAETGEWLGLPLSPPAEEQIHTRSEVMGDAAQTDRWKLWKVGAECREIGGVECYDGYHIGMIEHVITVTLLPSLAHKQDHATLALRSPSTSSISSLDITEPAGPLHTNSTSFAGRLAGALAREFEYLLHWDLPVSTIVQFNEVGKATHIRDVVDLQDAIETFVPLAKRFNWLTRRITGLVTSTLGSVVMNVLQTPTIQIKESVTVGGATSAKEKEALGLGFTFGRAPSQDLYSGNTRIGDSATASPSSEPIQPQLQPPAHEAHRPSVRANTLGLEGVDSPPYSGSRGISKAYSHRLDTRSESSAGMAPDRDEE